MSIKKFRRGISLTEVLISMGVLTIGLLGVAAMFPVGSYYMLKADIADRGSAIAHAAFADVVDKGMLQPDAWVMDQGDYFRTSLTSRYKTYSAANPAAQAPHYSQEFAYAFVIDPLAIAHLINSGIDTNNLATFSRFPNCPNVQRPSYNVMGVTNPSWLSFAVNPIISHRLPIRRVTFWDPRPPQDPMVPREALGLRAAEALFHSLDDLAIDQPDKRTDPGQTLWDSADLTNNGQQQPLARQSRGDYSWLATVCPTTVAGRDALLKGQSSHLYDVSIVVFYKRALSDLNSMRQTEAIVRGHVASTGTSGGEMILNVESNLTGNVTDPIKNLKVGEYIMVTGPHPESTPTAPRLFLQWYRVMSVDALAGAEATAFGDNDTLREVKVSLRGPDWPWQPAPGGPRSIDTANIANDLRIGIFPGAVAVHTKTTRLANGAASGSQWSALGPQHPDIPPSPYKAL